jgi:branched-chain amino acid transport system substrate-binding protein
VKVGIMSPLTGVQTRTGTNFERFIRLGIDDVNATGGIKVGGKSYRLEAVTVDDKSTSDGGREAANRLVLAEKVKIIMGGGTAQTAGAQPFTEPNKVLLLSMTILDASGGSKFPLTFAVGPHVALRDAAIYGWLAKTYPNVKRVVFAAQDDSTGRQIQKLAVVSAKKAGLEVVAQEFYPVDTKDFSPVVTRILRNNPDALDGSTAGRGTLLLGLAKALSEQGFHKPHFGISADMAAVQEGVSVLEGFTVPVLADWNASVVTAAERDLITRYIAKYGERDLETFAVPTYNAPIILRQAMEKAGTLDDVEKIATVLRTSEFETMWSKQYGKSRFGGEKSYGMNFTLEQPIYMSGVRKGKVVTFDVFKGTMP